MILKKKPKMEHIIRDYPNCQSQWMHLTTYPMANTRFLLIFAPVFEYVKQCLSDLIQADEPLSSLFSDQQLTQWISDDLATLLMPMIDRVIAVELACAGERGALQAKTARGRYNEFIKRLSMPDNLFVFLQKYSELNRSIQCMVFYYLNSTVEFLSHLSNDWQHINNQFLQGQKKLKITSISGSGDTHRQGRRVIILTLQAHKHKAMRVVYKPHTLAVDVAFAEWVKWFNQQLPEYHLYSQSVLDCKDHGWVEFVPYQPCSDDADVRLFYRRSGALLGLLFAIGGNDMHAENLIAYGSQPVLVDFECLFKPALCLKETDNELEQPRPIVMESLLLPYRAMIREDYAGYDLSGMGGQGNQVAPFKMKRWQKAGTDRLHLAEESSETEGKQNLPKIGRKVINPVDYEDSFQRGFREAYQLLIDNKKFLLSKQSPLNYFKQVEIRVLLRSTSEYAVLLYESFYPTLLSDVKARKAHFAQLDQVKKYAVNYKYVIPSEKRDLWEGDIPFFSMQVNQSFIVDSLNKRLDLPLVSDSWKRCLNHMRDHINTEDCRLQQVIINNCFESKRMNDIADLSLRLAVKINPHKQLTLRTTATTQRNKTDLKKRSLSLAGQAFRELKSKCIQTKENLAWPQVAIDQDLAWNPAMTGHAGLYSGTGGIVLAMAYADRYLPGHYYRSYVHTYMQSLENAFQLESKLYQSQVLSDDEKARLSFSNIGAFSGLGAEMYVLAKLYELYHDVRYTKLLHRLAKHSLARISFDKSLDMLAGSAGLLWVVIKIRGLLAPALAKKIMDACVVHIMKHYPKPSIRPPFQSEDKEGQAEGPLLGFSHGLFGFMTSLTVYNQMFPNPKVTRWLNAAKRYHQTQFCDQHKNWPSYGDTASNGQSNGGFQSAWCHGAPGIGMGLTALSPYGAGDEYDDYRKASLQGTLDNFDQSPLACLCHGFMGNLDLFVIDQNHHQDIHKDEYTSLWAYSVSMLEQHGMANLMQAKGFQPGLLMGVSGCAYQLLRCAYPDKVPSLLVLE